MINGEIPGEVESLMFCLQTGIGVGVIFFFIGKFSERTKWEKTTGKKLNEFEKEE
jgi:cobalt/nickel transport protein